MLNPFKFFSEVKQEGRKVTWATKQETISVTIVVIIMVFVFSFFFLFADFAINKLIKLFLGI